ncbi:MAG: DUF1963 domain-containing protein [Planctomycetes bacterium]|nr:DUF1963 domain-containing protein [Planctomycetota bacterium]
MSDPIEGVLGAALSRGCFGLLVAGDDGAARALVRDLAGALEGAHALGFSRDPDGWPASLRVVALGGEVTLAQGLRAALRQDPDWLVAEAPTADLPLDLLVTATQTGHGVLVRAAGCPDERPLVEALGEVEWAASAFPRVVVADARGVARIVAADGAPVWTRGAPLPAPERATGHGRFVPPPPLVREPTPPLDPDVLERLRARLAPHVRPTFVPVLAPPSDDAARSRLGGRPLLAPGEVWPRCGDCGAPMPLAVQLARAELPAEAAIAFPPGAEHLQLFYCTSDACGVTDPASPGARNRLLRILDRGEPAPAPPGFSGVTRLAPQDVVGWERRLETPGTEDADLPDDLREARWRLADRVANGEATPEEVPLAGPLAGQKLLGWPMWTQAPGWEACPRCGERMTFVFQVDANQGPLEMLFAADGTGHVSQCPAHPDVVVFTWACG